MKNIFDKILLKTKSLQEKILSQKSKSNLSRQSPLNSNIINVEQKYQNDSIYHIMYVYYFLIIKLGKMRGCFGIDSKQKNQNFSNQGNTEYQPYQIPYQQTSATNEAVQSSNLYPKLPDLSNEALMTKMTEQVVKNYTGWVEEKPKNDAQGETKFVEQIGLSTLKMKKLGQSNPNQQSSGWGEQPNRQQASYGNQNSGQNPFQLWDIASKNIQGSQHQFNPNQNQYNQNQQSQQYSNQYAQGQGYYNTQGGGQGQNRSLWDNPIIQNISFHINPIFQQGIVKHKFPSPFIKYKIIPYMDEKKVLDVTSVNQPKKGLKKNNLIIWDYHGGPNQLFYIKQQNNGLCYIVNIARGFVLKLPERPKNQDEPMVVNPRAGSSTQMWTLQPSNFGCYEIVNKVSGLALDLFHQKSQNGTPVIQWKRTGAKNQKWRIVPA